MDLNHKVVTLYGQQYYIMAEKPTHDPNISIYLLGTLGEKTDYSLWNVETVNDGDVDFWPYKGEDTKDLQLELMEYFVQHAFDSQPTEKE